MSTQIICQKMKKKKKINPGDLVRNKNSESGEIGLFIGFRVFKNKKTGEEYTCSEVYWPERSGKYSVGTIQTDLLEYPVNT